jgi:hypothetical protein
MHLFKQLLHITKRKNMKSKYFKSGIALLLGGLLICCQKKLEEQPVSILTPAFFKTAQGFLSGLDAAYAGNRNLWGTENFATFTVAGTDEFTSGRDGNNTINKYASSYNSSTGAVSAIWRNCYTFINTCNGLIDNAANVQGISTSQVKQMVAEAKFLRANYYFILVKGWGDVTLNTHFQSDATTSASRQPVADVYKFIIQDLTEAIVDLPPSPMQNGVLPGKATAAVARHLLAMVYLTRAYSTAKQNDDFQNAYNNAKNLIDNSALLGLGLLQDFGQVYAPGNEANKEVLWSVQHTPNLAYNSAGTSDNQLSHHFLSVYDAQPGLMRSIAYGRPFSRFMPTRWLTDTVFKERLNDQRYAKTFQVTWLSNNAATIPKTGSTPKYTLGDTALYLPGVDVSDAKIAASRYQLVPPRKYSLTVYPSMIKYIDPNRPDVNAQSIRSVIAYRISETYLIAAEAAFNLSNTPAAAQHINTVRARAAYPGGNVTAMDITPATVTLDFILDERSRELCGEQSRWFDLVRTGKLIERVKKHNPDGAVNIRDYHIFRPIPQSQIDAVITGDRYPQNPGF